MQCAGPGAYRAPTEAAGALPPPHRPAQGPPAAAGVPHGAGAGVGPHLAPQLPAGQRLDCRVCRRIVWPAAGAISCASALRLVATSGQGGGTGAGNPAHTAAGVCTAPAEEHQLRSTSWQGVWLAAQLCAGHSWDRGMHGMLVPERLAILTLADITNWCYKAFPGKLDCAVFCPLQADFCSELSLPTCLPAFVGLVLWRQPHSRPARDGSCPWHHTKAVVGWSFVCSYSQVLL